MWGHVWGTRGRYRLWGMSQAACKTSGCQARQVMVPAVQGLPGHLAGGTRTGGTCLCFWFAPLHKGTAPSVTTVGYFPCTNTASLTASQSFYFKHRIFSFCMWSSFVYLLEKIRRVTREHVFLLIPISYLQLHYEHLLSPSWGLKLKQNMNIDTSILPFSAQAAHMTHSAVGMRRRKATS